MTTAPAAPLWLRGTYHLIPASLIRQGPECGLLAGQVPTPVQARAASK